MNEDFLNICINVRWRFFPLRLIKQFQTWGTGECLLLLIVLHFASLWTQPFSLLARNSSRRTEYPSLRSTIFSSHSRFFLCRRRLCTFHATFLPSHTPFLAIHRKFLVCHPTIIIPIKVKRNADFVSLLHYNCCYCYWLIDWPISLFWNVWFQWLLLLLLYELINVDFVELCDYNDDSFC